MTRLLHNTKQPRILAIHLLNDLSGSPLVFRQALQALLQDNYEIHLFTATPSGKGFLNDLQGVKIHPLFYRWSRNRWITLLFYLSSQVSLFLRILFFSRSADLIYINSMLPFGAAIAAKIRKCRVIYHIHEVSIRPALLKNWLTGVIRHTADHCIYVSGYTRLQTPVNTASSVVYNALPAAFTEKAVKSGPSITQQFTVLMICSLKPYKGIAQFADCARSLPDLRFELVLNASRGDIDRYFMHTGLPENLMIYDAHPDTHRFYKKASVVVNLSLSGEWIETFGMTILEAMWYRKPVIVPVAGGVVELVENGRSGFCLDSGNVPLIVAAIRKLAGDPAFYARMSEAAYQRAHLFGHAQFNCAISEIMEGLSERPVNIMQQIQQL